MDVAYMTILNKGGLMYWSIRWLKKSSLQMAMCVYSGMSAFMFQTKIAIKVL